MTFFERFEKDILSGAKTITIRDTSEKNYEPGSTVQVSTFEQGRWFCQLKVLSVTPIGFTELTEIHAKQENMTLTELKQVIQEIYPNVQQLFVIQFQLA